MAGSSMVLSWLITTLAVAAPSDFVDGLLHVPSYDVPASSPRDNDPANPILLEGEMLERQGASRIQKMNGFGPDWSGNAHLLWDGEVGEALVTAIEAPVAGRYRVWIDLTLAPDYGIATIHLNDKKVAEAIDTYAPRVERREPLDLGVHQLDRGRHPLKMQLTGANPKARKLRGKRYLFGIDTVRLVRVDLPKDKPAKPTDEPRSQPKPKPEQANRVDAPNQRITLADVNPVLATHCHKCHGGEKTKGKVDLVALRAEHLPDRLELLEDMIIAIEDGDMPPEEGDKPGGLPKPLRNRLAAQLTGLLKQSRPGQPFEPTPIRRMNRFQYNNAVTDLLGLTREVFPLPERLMRRDSAYFKPGGRHMPDVVKVASRPLGKDHDGQRPEGFRGVGAFPQDRRAEHGFDNQADHLTLSPLLMESFLRLSQSIAESPDLNPNEATRWREYFEEKPDPKQALLKKRVASMLRRAFRRPPDAATLRRFVAFAQRQRQKGRSLNEAMHDVLSAVLASPEFLYLYAIDEGATEGKPGRRRVSEMELATRLSLYLWSSIPDDTLLTLAEKGQLADPKVLNAQIDRMLNDPKVARFCDVFPGQWLQLDLLVAALPDQKKHKHFYWSNGYRTSMHMMQEPLLLFETVFLEDRPITKLIEPTFTWQSKALKAHYAGAKKMPTGEVKTLTYRRVPRSDERYGGVITNAAVMTMTSGPHETQPITRGAWVNGVIFNTPPEPPPADVPPLPKPDKDELAKLTIRERFAVHRKRSDCAACHKRLDPLGFALENYDPTGLWRDKYENGREVDTSGVLFDRHAFKDPVAFRRGILKEKRRFLRGFAAHLMSYALGRQLGPADSRALDAIADRAMAGQDSLRSMMKMVALSEPFHHKNLKRISQPSTTPGHGAKP